MNRSSVYPLASQCRAPFGRASERPGRHSQGTGRAEFVEEALIRGMRFSLHFASVHFSETLQAASAAQTAQLPPGPRAASALLRRDAGTGEMPEVNAGKGAAAGPGTPKNLCERMRQWRGLLRPSPRLPIPARWWGVLPVASDTGRRDEASVSKTGV